MAQVVRLQTNPAAAKLTASVDISVEIGASYFKNTSLNNPSSERIGNEGIRVSSWPTKAYGGDCAVARALARLSR